MRTVSVLVLVCCAHLALAASGVGALAERTLLQGGEDATETQGDEYSQDFVDPIDFGNIPCGFCLTSTFIAVRDDVEESEDVGSASPFAAFAETSTLRVVGFNLPALLPQPLETVTPEPVASKASPPQAPPPSLEGLIGEIEKDLSSKPPSTKAPSHKGRGKAKPPAPVVVAPSTARLVPSQPPNKKKGKKRKKKGRRTFGSSYSAPSSSSAAASFAALSNFRADFPSLFVPGTSAPVLITTCLSLLSPIHYNNFGLTHLSLFQQHQQQQSTRASARAGRGIRGATRASRCGEGGWRRLRRWLRLLRGGGRSRGVLRDQGQRLPEVRGRRD